MERGIGAAPVRDRFVSGEPVAQRVEGDFDPVRQAGWSDGAGREWSEKRRGEKEERGARAKPQAKTSSTAAKLADRTPSPNSA